MASTKRKELANPKKSQKAKVLSSPKSKAQSGSTEVERLLSYWEEELRSLNAQEFKSIEDAQVAVIGSVVERLGGTEKQKKAASIFLNDLFATDPELLKSIEPLVRTR